MLDEDKNKILVNRRRRRLNKLALALRISAASVLIAGLGISTYQWLGNHQTERRAAKLLSAANQGHDTSVPSTNKPSPDAFSSYNVAPDNPRYLFINKISIQSIVRPLGVTDTGQLATPSNVFDVGWYTGSSKPSKPGATIIDGHVSSWTTKGIFYDLKKLSYGDDIQIELGNGTTINYTVVSVKTYDYLNVNMSAVLSPVNPSKSGLNLITCTGDVIKGTNEFNQRIVVFAEQST